MKALDLFCGAGGVAIGLLQAGFDQVVGIDTDHRCAKVYPGNFILADVQAIPVKVQDFDFVWASPPCQKFSIATNYRYRDKHKYKDFIPLSRSLLENHPYTCIENVPNAPIRSDLVLTGPMFGLNRIQRRRHFETSFFCLQPPVEYLKRDAWKNGNAITVTTSLCASSHFYPRKKRGLPGRVPPAEACEAMGINLPMTGRQVGESVPPPYSKFIGEQALNQIRRN